MAEIKNLNVPRESSGIGPPPPHLPEDYAEAWNELVNVAPHRAWIAADRLWIEMAAVLLVRDRESADPEIRRSLLVVLSKALLEQSALETLGIDYSGEWPVSDDI